MAKSGAQHHAVFDGHIFTGDTRQRRLRLSHRQFGEETQAFQASHVDADDRDAARRRFGDAQERAVTAERTTTTRSCPASMRLCSTSVPRPRSQAASSLAKRPASASSIFLVRSTRRGLRRPAAQNRLLIFRFRKKEISAALTGSQC